MHSDKFLFSNVSLAGLLTVLYSATDMKTFINGKYHYFLYYLVLSIYPRMLITVTFHQFKLLVKREHGTHLDLSKSGQCCRHSGRCRET